MQHNIAYVDIGELSSRPILERHNGVDMNPMSVAALGLSLFLPGISCSEMHRAAALLASR
jgi:hypothetical protein